MFWKKVNDIERMGNHPFRMMQTVLFAVAEIKAGLRQLVFERWLGQQPYPVDTSASKN